METSRHDPLDFATKRSRSLSGNNFCLTPGAANAYRAHGPSLKQTSRAVTLGLSLWEHRMAKRPQSFERAFITCRSAARRRALSRHIHRLAFVAILAAIMPLAYASIVDPTWIAGIYDGADYDEVVSLLTETTEAVKTGSNKAVKPADVVTRVVPHAVAPLSDTTVLLAFHLRSPPELMMSLSDCSVVFLPLAARPPNQLKLRGPHQRRVHSLRVTTASLAGLLSRHEVAEIVVTASFLSSVGDRSSAPFFLHKETSA